MAVRDAASRRLPRAPRAQADETAAAYAALVQQSPEHMYVLDPDGTIRFANRVSPPHTLESVLGTNVACHVGAEPEAVRLAIARVVATGNEEQHVFSAPIGTQTRWYVAHLKRGGSTRTPQVLVFVRDVTERRAAEQALKATVRELEESRRQVLHAQKMESVGRLAGGVAHDFNNLLTAIISFTRFVMDDMGSQDPRRADLVEVLKAADSATKLTRQLLAFSRKQTVEPVLIELNGAIRRFARVLQRTLEESIHLRIVESPEPAHVVCDPGQLDQLIMNLAVNARDAMPNGGSITMTVGRRALSGHPELPDGQYAALEVRDTGSGMAPEIISQIFEPFFTTKGERGTGLGLATCYGIAKQAKGHIEVDSHVGMGSKFTVLLPLDRVESARASSPPAPQQQPERVEQRVALVVEDQAAIRRSILRSLEKAGFNVIDTRTAEEALAVVEDLQTRVDLLVTDIVLPGLDGIKLAQRLRAGRPELRVLVCSGYAGDAKTGELEINSATAFLSKPFAGEALVAAAAGLFA